jgi:hypothetical protein
MKKYNHLEQHLDKSVEASNITSDRYISIHPLLSRVIREGGKNFCSNCGSTMSKNGFLGLFGKILCHNNKCPNSK